MKYSDLLSRLNSRKSPIAVIGLGYVGLPLAVEIARAGYRTVGIDLDVERVAAVNAGRTYIDDVEEQSLAECAGDGRLTATTDFSSIGQVDAVIICVPTPLDRHKQPDLTYVESALNSALPHLLVGQLVILESTTFPGTTEEVLRPRIEARGLVVGKDVFLAFSPERVDPGNPRYKTRNTPKVVGGTTPACTELCAALYERVLDSRVVRVSSPRVAEMTKLLENIYRGVNISLVNELALLCERMDINIWEVIEAAKTKPFGFMPFYPGPGLGGHCIPLDPFYLSWKAKEYDFSTRFIELAGQINDAMPYHVVQRAVGILSSLGRGISQAKVLLLGVAYKRDISDVRESPALRIAELLVKRGAQLSYHDPHVASIRILDRQYQSSALDAACLRSQHLVIITTDHSGIDYPLVVAQSAAVYDTRNATRGLASESLFRLGAGVPRRSLASSSAPSGGSNVHCDP